MDRVLLDRSLAYIDSWLRWRVPRAGIPGCVVAVSYRGRVLFAEGYGRSDLAGDRPMQADEVFRIASHSKTFTATAVMQLVEQGRLRLDDPVADHVSWLTEHRDSRFRQLTVRQLLSHGAGVIRDGLDANFWQRGRKFPDGRELRNEVLAADLVTDPNVALKYSNIGYGLLGAVIEAVGGQTYHRYVTENIVERLGLENTSPEPTGALAERLVTGYTRAGADGARSPIPPIDSRALAAATGFASTAADMCLYFTAHFVGSSKLLSDASKREMQRVHWHAHRPGLGVEEDYGLGLELEVVGERRMIGHGGGWPGHSTKTYADPSSQLVVVVLTNCIDGPAADIGRGVLGVVDCFQGFAGTPAARGLRRLEGRYVNLWQVRDVIHAGAHMIAGSPLGWAPLADPDRLERVDATTLRIADASSFGAPGELIRFHLSDGAVATVTWSGSTLWPEDRWPVIERRLLRR